MENTESTVIKISVRENADLFTSAQMQIAPLGQSQRLTKALKYFFITFSATLIAIVIPILHFILVPLGMVVSVLIFIKVFNTRNTRQDTSVICPKCNKTFVLKAKAFNWPTKEECSHCLSSLVVDID